MERLNYDVLKKSGYDGYVLSLIHIFSVSGNGIRYGLSAIKSVGRAVVDVIIAERENGGLFKSLDDFVSRMSNKEVNKRTLESLSLIHISMSCGSISRSAAW